MFFGYNTQMPSFNITQQSSVLHESQVSVLQRESENYIRKVELEKKHFYSIEEQYQQTKHEWLQMKEELKKIQYAKTLPTAKQQTNKIQNLQYSLEQCILKYNDSQTTNQHLKDQINMLRKERAQFLKISKAIKDELNDLKQETVSKEKGKKEMEEDAMKREQQIENLKKKNEEQNSEYVGQFDRLQKEVMGERKRYDGKTKKEEKNDKPTNIDTHTVLKYRLKKLIANNKEKVRLIETYWRNMKIIDDCFNQIKETSGIQDIDEIKNTFIKSEEQNYSLYTIVDKNQQKIQELSIENQNLKNKIFQQQIDNDAKRKQKAATPIAERNMKKNKKIIQSKQDEINALRKKMSDIAPALQSILLNLSKNTMDKIARQDYELSFNLNEGSLEKYLQDLEKYIDLTVAKEKLSLNLNISQSTLLLDDIPIKDFHNQPKQITNDDLPKEEEKNTIAYASIHNYKYFRELASDNLKKKK